MVVNGFADLDRRLQNELGLTKVRGLGRGHVNGAYEPGNRLYRLFLGITAFKRKGPRVNLEWQYNEGKRSDGVILVNIEEIDRATSIDCEPEYSPSPKFTKGHTARSTFNSVSSHLQLRYEHVQETPRVISEVVTILRLYDVFLKARTVLPTTD